MEINKLKNILEAVLLASDKTLSVVQLENLFELDEERPSRDEIRQALHEMTEDYETRGYELKQVASGFRLQVRQEFSTWVGRLWEEKPARYTRALLETISLIAYRQPITRGEIEEVRGVSVSSNIIKTLLERDWVKVLGHKDVPGKPSLYGTTKEFLDYFNLKSLDQLPTLAEIKDLDSIHPELALGDGEILEENSLDADVNQADVDQDGETADTENLTSDVVADAAVDTEVVEEEAVDKAAVDKEVVDSDIKGESAAEFTDEGEAANDVVESELDVESSIESDSDSEAQTDDDLVEENLVEAAATRAATNA